MNESEARYQAYKVLSELSPSDSSHNAFSYGWNSCAEYMKSVKDQLEKFADPNNYYAGNEFGDAMYRGNAIKEARAALNAECPFCGKSLNGETLFHIACADEEAARADAEYERASKVDIPF